MNRTTARSFRAAIEAHEPRQLLSRIYGEHFDAPGIGSANASWSADARAAVPSTPTDLFLEHAVCDDESTSLTLRQLTAGRVYTLRFTVIVIRSERQSVPRAEGERAWSLSLGERSLASAVSRAGASADPFEFSGAADSRLVVRRKYSDGLALRGQEQDRVYRASVRFKAESEKALLKFATQGFHAGLNETWGIDDMTVSSLSDPGESVPMSDATTHFFQQGDDTFGMSVLDPDGVSLADAGGPMPEIGTFDAANVLLTRVGDVSGPATVVFRFASSSGAVARADYKVSHGAWLDEETLTFDFAAGQRRQVLDIRPTQGISGPVGVRMEDAEGSAFVELALRPYQAADLRLNHEPHSGSQLVLQPTLQHSWGEEYGEALPYDGEPLPSIGQRFYPNELDHKFATPFNADDDDEDFIPDHEQESYDEFGTAGQQQHDDDMVQLFPVLPAAWEQMAQAVANGEYGEDSAVTLTLVTSPVDADPLEDAELQRDHVLSNYRVWTNPWKLDGSDSLVLGKTFDASAPVASVTWRLADLATYGVGAPLATLGRSLWIEAVENEAGNSGQSAWDVLEGSGLWLRMDFKDIGERAPALEGEPRADSSEAILLSPPDPMVEIDVNADGDLDDSVDGIANFLPGYLGPTPVLTPDAPQAVKVIVSGLVAGRTYALELAGVTTLPGIASNADSNFGANDAPDFVLLGSTGVANAAGMLVMAMQVNDFGGQAKVIVEDVSNGSRKVAEKEVVADADKDGLPDAWEKLYGGDDLPEGFKKFDPNKAQEPDGGRDEDRNTDQNPPQQLFGDRLSAFDEYRGFLVIDPADATKDKHERTSPVLKNVFVFAPEKDPFLATQNNDDGFQPDPANGQFMGVGAVSTEVPVTIHHLRETQFWNQGAEPNPNAPSPKGDVNFNSPNPVGGVKQKRVWITTELSANRLWDGYGAIQALLDVHGPNRIVERVYNNIGRAAAWVHLAMIRSDVALVDGNGSQDTGSGGADHVFARRTGGVFNPPAGFPPIDQSYQAYFGGTIYAVSFFRPEDKVVWWDKDASQGWTLGDVLWFDDAGDDRFDRDNDDVIVGPVDAQGNVGGATSIPANQQGVKLHQNTEFRYAARFASPGYSLGKDIFTVRFNRDLYIKSRDVMIAHEALGHPVGMQHPALNDPERIATAMVDDIAITASGFFTDAGGPKYFSPPTTFSQANKDQTRLT